MHRFTALETIGGEGPAEGSSAGSRGAGRTRVCVDFEKKITRAAIPYLCRRPRAPRPRAHGHTPRTGPDARTTNSTRADASPVDLQGRAAAKVRRCARASAVEGERAANVHEVEGEVEGLLPLLSERSIVAVRPEGWRGRREASSWRQQRQHVFLWVCSSISVTSPLPLSLAGRTRRSSRGRRAAPGRRAGRRSESRASLPSELRDWERHGTV